MFKEKENYYEIEEFLKKGAGAVYTKQCAGNLSFYVLNEEEKVAENRRKLMEELRIEEYELFYAKQTHSANIKVIEKDDVAMEYDNIDGFVTDRDDVAILTQYADCLPVYLYDSAKKVIASVHGGWQGLYSMIHTKAVDIMEEKYGCSPENIDAAVGIGIKSCCYEISDEFYDKFMDKFGNELCGKTFERVNERWHFDLEKFAATTLEERGLKKDKIVSSGICTKCSGKFNSYRRDKDKSGRNGAVIYLKKEQR